VRTVDDGAIIQKIGFPTPQEKQHKKRRGSLTLLIPNAGLGEAYQKDKQRS
jgi:hypothetical protein